jgi:hypothetical protein
MNPPDAPDNAPPGGPNLVGGGAAAAAAGATDSWETLVAEAKLLDGGVAKAWATTYATTPLTDVLAPLAFGTAPDAMALPAAHRMRMIADSLTSVTLLVAVGDHFQVIYGLRPCHHVPGGGTRLLALMGERTVRAAFTGHPKLVKVRGNIVAQTSAFETVTARAAGPDAIALALAGDPTQLLPELDDAAPEITTIKALPLHRKWAALFLAGLPIGQGYALATRLLAATPGIPDGIRDSVQAFFRCAITGRAPIPANPVVSILQGGWTRMDYGDSDHPRLEDWFYDLVDREVPTTPQPPPPGPPGPHGPQPPATVTQADAIATAFAALAERFAGRPNDPTASTHNPPYNPFELERLFLACGTPRPWDGLGEESLPRFHLEFQSMRRKTETARMFLEGYRKQNYPPTGIVYPFLFSTQLITDLRTLNLDGNDELFLWENRRRGFSLFAFAPLEAASHGATRSQMIFFEETAAQHGPTERAAMAKLSETLADVPSTSDRLFRWIDHFHLSLAMFFGPTCPVLPKTRELLTYLRNPRFFVGYEPADYVALLWRIHTAVRAFFHDGSVRILERICADIEQHSPPTRHGLPAELRPGPDSPTSIIPGIGNPSRRAPRARPDGPVPRDLTTPPTKQRRAPASPPFTATFQADLDRAREAARGRGLSFLGRDLCSSHAAIKTLLGPEFLKLCPQSNVCIKRFLLGECRSIDNCNYAHELTGVPTAGCINGIGLRIKARVDAYIADLAASPKA